MPGALGFIGWLIVGGLAGWIASKIKGTDASQGIFLNIVVGIVGALIGGWVLGLVGVNTEGAGLILTFLTAILGAVILITIVQFLTKKK
ncbi:hypothetical protein BK816_04870 [Boudabousia tangfeifanii]|uniref:Transglycosylase n=1 Tax=Boudabousia tangfeifanii TaxID=1912795 RepID=A0A1D9MK96_9ACTO|nr:GlsB/YeaQ/YmgE family stress response membrane protein [Boudabousia tangfeifanii]AOZ72706.1 hypothetical protein BK816_04870 [Boudabousia tangfeifanii]